MNRRIETLLDEIAAIKLGYDKLTDELKATSKEFLAAKIEERLTELRRIAA